MSGVTLPGLPGPCSGVDGGQSWEPLAFTGEEDFHVLTAGPDGQVYGIGSSSPAVQISGDSGSTWTAGSEVTAADLAVTADGVIYAAGLALAVFGCKKRLSRLGGDI